jgi:glyoxylase-like metal-dependent hydrolase (beta-lactamase superfamily II)
MKIIGHPLGAYQANCYIVYDENTKDGFIIDPGDEGSTILDVINREKLNIKFIILTHGHFDHIGAVNKIKEALNIPVYMNEKDGFMIKSGKQKIGMAYPKFENFNPDRFVKEGDTISCGGNTIEIIETPGHTPGGISIKLDGYVFTGDTLFAGSIGRYDFEGGSFEDIVNSIKNKLFTLPDDTIVCPGHGQGTKIGIEKETSSFF